MTKLTKREQYLIIIALLFSSLALLANLYYFPLKDEIKELEHHSSDLDSKITEASTRVVLVEKTKNEIAQLEDELKSRRDFLMDTLDEADLLDYISDIILSNGRLTSISYSSSENNDIYFAKNINISFITSYEGLNRILTAFEDGDKFTVAPSIRVSLIEEISQEVDTSDEDDTNGESQLSQVTSSSQDLSVNLTARFFAAESAWDGSGEYDFMNGIFGKTNIFQ